MLDKSASASKSLVSKEMKTVSLTVLYNIFPIIIFLVCFLMLFLAWTYFLEPKFKAISSGEEVAKKRAEYNIQGNYYKKLASLKNAYRDIKQSDIDKINKIVDVPNETSSFYNEFDYLAKANKMVAMSISSVSTDDSFEISNMANSNKRNDLVSETRVWRTTIGLTEVSYYNLVNLLSTIETNLRLMDVQKVAYDPIARTATIELLTYHRKK